MKIATKKLATFILSFCKFATNKNVVLTKYSRPYEACSIKPFYNYNKCLSVLKLVELYNMPNMDTKR